MGLKQSPAKQEKRAAEVSQIQIVRDAVMRRDYKGCRACVVGVPKDPNGLPILEWAHLGDKTRAKTRNMAPEERHGTPWTMCLCRFHHGTLDNNYRLKIQMGASGADAPVLFLFTVQLGIILSYPERGWTTPTLYA